MRIDDSNVLAALTQADQQTGLLADFDFSSGHVYATTRVHPVVYSSNTYSPLFYQFFIEPIKEAADSQPNGLRMGFSGLDASALSYALSNTSYCGRTVALRMGWFNEDDSLIGVSKPLRMMMSHADASRGEQNTIAMNCESDSARWFQSKPLYSTNATQFRLLSGDTFFDQGPYLQDKTIYWGGIRIVPGSNTGTGGGGQGPGSRGRRAED